MADVVITLPATVRWEEYARELDEAARGAVMNFRVPSRPKAQRHDRCYLVHRGAVRGWMAVLDVVHHAEGFRCTTTGRAWPPGFYLQRRGPFHPVRPVPMRGFQGYRYWTGPAPTDA